MTSSPGTPALSGAAAFVQRVFDRWRGGLAVALTVAVVLTLRFTLLGGGIYESRAIFALAPEARASAGALAQGALTKRLEAAIPELSSLRARNDVQGVAIDEANGRLLLACRGYRPLAAHQRCGQLVSRALKGARELRILQPASVPTQALPASIATRALVVFASAWMGLTTGVLWMVGLALLPRAPDARRDALASIHPPSAGARSLAPPASARVLSIERPESSEQDDGPGHARRPTSAAPQPLVHLDVDGAWLADRPPPFAEQPADLLQLCNHLYVAAAQHCFVVGLSSELRERPLKSRMAAQLAWLLARSEHARILLLELDLEFPNVDRVMSVDMPPHAGFSQQVHARAAEDERGPWLVVRCTPHLSVLAEGRVRTPGVLHARQLAAALAALRPHFDVIVADGPTCDADEDRRALGELVDGVVFVASTSDSDAQAIANATSRFDGRQLLAVVTTAEADTARGG